MCMQGDWDKSLNPHGRKLLCLKVKVRSTTLILPPPPSFILLSCTLGTINVAKFAL